MNTSALMPHGWCMVWNPRLIALNVVTDALVAISYYSIPAALFFVVWRKQITLSLQPLLILFGLFIALCGGGHLLDIFSIWRPIYWFKGFWNAGTAAASVVTAIVLIPRAMDFIRMPERTERLEREAVQLRQQSSLLQTVIDSVEEGIILLDGSGAALLQNPAADRLIAAGKGILDTTRLVAASPDLWDLPDGRKIERALTPAPGYGQLLVLRDLSGRLQAERNRLRLERIISSMKQGFAVVSLESGRFLQTNDSFDAMHGAPNHQLVDTPASGIYAGTAGEREQTFEDIRAECVRTGFWDGETRHQQLDGAEFHCVSRFNLYREFDRDFLSSMHYDVTEQKRIKEDAARVQARLLQSAKLESLGLLAGGVAHDFNNILTGILGNNSLALEFLDSEHPVRPLLNSAIDAAERAARLTNQLLAYSGKGRFVIEPVNLIKLARDIARLVQSSIPSSVVLRIEDCADLPLVKADVSQLHQVIMNLLINGAEAMGDRPGSVTVRAGACTLDSEFLRMRLPLHDVHPGEYVWISVEDTGCGMDPVTLSQIFDPFFTTKFTGRGLGLAAVQGIVRGHRGAIDVYSRPGVGTCFTVYLPPAGESEDEKVFFEDSAAGRGSGSVLVIDDEEFVRDAAVQALRHFGYEPVAMSDGLAGIEYFHKHARELKLVLLDMTMPLLSGEETLVRLRQADADVPVLLMSGFAESEVAPQTANWGTDGFLQKPFTSKGLLDAVRASIQSRPRQQSSQSSA